MSQRVLAGILAVPLLIGLWIYAALTPLPYVTYAPGVTVDVLAEDADAEIVQVSGAKSYHDDGELRMTTVYVTRPQADVTLFETLDAWIDPDEAVYPYDAVYSPEETPEDSRTQSAVQMVSSQDSAIAVALGELGYDVTSVVEVLNVDEELPSAGVLKVRDVLKRVGSTEISTPQDVVEAVDEAPVDVPLPVVVERGRREVSLEVTPREVDGDKRIGIVPGPGFVFPIDVSVNIDPAIGGPSAGLMFSLAIYDTLTPGSLTDGAVVAGTGTIDPEGRVGPIGGIQQKIAASREDGAELFLVPADNCAEALGAAAGDTRLVRTETMSAAVEAIKAWVADPDADLPSCEED